VVAFESKKFTDAQTRYLNHDKELLSVVHALQTWRHYLQNGQPITVYTDNAATKYIMSKDVSKLNNRQKNWLAILAEYCPELRHLPGPENVVADALSRRYQITLIMWADLSTDLLKRVYEEAQADPEYQKLVQAVENPTPATSGQAGSYLVRERLLYKKAGDMRDSKDLLYIPAGSLRTRLLEQAHDVPECGHLGRDKTLERLQRHFYWPGMKRAVLQFCTSCESCQLNKPSRRPPIGLLYPLDPPRFPWRSMGMDFIMSLPKTKNGHTAIATFVDRHSKMIHLWPCTDAVTAEQTMEIFLKAVWKHHGIPQEIVSDRDPRFVSDFWKALHKRLGTRFNMSTANHPQTDGQAERANGVVEEMLRSYTSIHQDDWDLHLDTVEYAYNDSEQASTGYTPFYACCGRHPHSPLSLLAPPPRVDGQAATQEEESIEEFSARMAAQAETIHASLRAAQARQAEYANKKRRDLEFQVGDRVLLSAEHLRDRNLALGATRKLAGKYEGPFLVKRKVSRVAYELDFPPGGAYAKIHPVIHVSRLREYIDPADPQFPGRTVRVPMEPIIVEGQARYVIDCFTRHRRWGKKKQLQFLVQWLGYLPSESTWKPAEHLQMDLLPREYWGFVRQYEERVLEGRSAFDLPQPEPEVKKTKSKKKTRAGAQPPPPVGPPPVPVRTTAPAPAVNIDPPGPTLRRSQRLLR
jgi:hypothetical protein